MARDMSLRCALLLVASVLPMASTRSALLLPRDYLDTVCKPPTKNPTDTVPPCVEIETIETLCTPNGTEPIYLSAHQQCMCGGSFFTEWPACQACLQLHGLRSERDVAQYDGILSAASSAFCGVPTPSAVFADVFSSLQGSYPVPTTGDTVSSDHAPSQTAVSLYYTASGYQGPGTITGAAASATATGLVTAPAGTGTGTVTRAAGTGSGSGSGGSSTPSNPGTKPTTGTSGSSSASATSKSNAAAVATGTVSLGAVALFGLVTVVALNL